MTAYKPKEPMLALLLSFFLLGLGQIYVGKVLRGVLFLIALLLGKALLFFYFIQPNTPFNITSISLIALLWIFEIYGLVDSYLVARRYNAEHHLEREISIEKRILWIAAIIILGFALSPTRFGAFAYIKDHYFRAYKTPSEAMDPAIQKGDRFLVDMAVYKKSEPQRGDIIIFKFDATKDYVKRVVGLPNETVEINNGKILINGIELNEEPFVSVNYINHGENGAEGKSVLVPADNYYVLGDNSQTSHDSRYGFFVSKDQIKGKVYKIFYPFNRSGPVH